MFYLLSHGIVYWIKFVSQNPIFVFLKSVSIKLLLSWCVMIWLFSILLNVMFVLLQIRILLVQWLLSLFCYMTSEYSSLQEMYSYLTSSLKTTGYACATRCKIKHQKATLHSIGQESESSWNEDGIKQVFFLLQSLL